MMLAKLLTGVLLSCLATLILGIPVTDEDSEYRYQQRMSPYRLLQVIADRLNYLEKLGQRHWPRLEKPEGLYNSFSKRGACISNCVGSAGLTHAQCRDLC